jgi:hypothetical protein
VDEGWGKDDNEDEELRRVLEESKLEVRVSVSPHIFSQACAGANRGAQCLISAVLFCGFVLAVLWVRHGECQRVFTRVHP